MRKNVEAKVKLRQQEHPVDDCRFDQLDNSRPFCLPAYRPIAASIVGLENSSGTKQVRAAL